MNMTSFSVDTFDENKNLKKKTFKIFLYGLVSFQLSNLRSRIVKETAEQRV